VLLDQLHAATRVSRAIVPVHVVGRARDHLSAAISVVSAIAITVAITVVVPIPIPVASATFHREVSPAAVVYPDALAA
jgi:hypothetical protein